MRNLSRVRGGDRALFYVGGRRGGKFAGRCVISSKPRSLLRSGRREEVRGMDYVIILDKVEIWNKPRFVKSLVDKIGFIDDKENWGMYLQGSLVPIPDEDFELIEKES